MWELDCEEGWVPKNWCIWTVVLEKTLESPLDGKEIQIVYPKGNQSWIFIGLMLKLKLQYFGHLMWRANSFEKTLMLGKIEDRRRRGWHRMRCWMASPTQWAWVWVSSGSWWRTGKPGVLQSMASQRGGHNWATELNWTEDAIKRKILRSFWIEWALNPRTSIHVRRKGDTYTEEKAVWRWRQRLQWCGHKPRTPVAPRNWKR